MNVSRATRFLRRTLGNVHIESVEAKLLKMPQADVPLLEEFGPGVYIRTVLMRKGTLVIGHEHRTRHFNNVFTGRARVVLGGAVTTICAPASFISEAGVRKVLFIEEDMIWQTIHPTEETDLQKLEEMLVNKSSTFKDHEIAEARLKLGLAKDPILLETSDDPKCASPTPESSSSAGGSHG